MISVTWVEMLLVGIFTATAAFSVGFCVSNYSGSDSLDLAKKTAE